MLCPAEWFHEECLYLSAQSPWISSKLDFHSDYWQFPMEPHSKLHFGLGQGMKFTRTSYDLIGAAEETSCLSADSYKDNCIVFSDDMAHTPKASRESSANCELPLLFVAQSVFRKKQHHQPRI